MTDVLAFGSDATEAGTSGRSSGPVSGAVRLTHATRAGLLADLRARFMAHQGFALATLNLDHLVKLGRDAGFRAAYLAQTHVVADGNPVVWLHRLAGRRVELIPGSDLIAPLCALAAETGTPLALFGSAQEVLDHAARALAADHPGLQVLAAIAPPQGFDPMGPGGEEAIAALGASGARLCLLALGAPKQELFAARAHGALPQMGFVSIGAGLDFIAGHQKRAPAWMRALALEWVWRMASNPRRLARRYLDCALILPGLALQARKEGRR